MGVRFAVGLLTVAIFAFFGFTWLESNRVLGVVCLVFAAIRLLRLLRDAWVLWGPDAAS